MAKLTNVKPMIAAAPAHLRQTSTAVERTRGKKWMQIRARILRRDPLCVLCLPDRYTQATEVDHILPVASGGTDAESNLRGLCHDCHAQVTAQFNRGDRIR